MKKLTYASLLSLTALPMLMSSQDASAFPAFARKYQTSCYTCHSGFPTRNAFGEAFKANGYRWPGGEDEEKAKQPQTVMGTEGWKKMFPESPWPTDIPGFAPLSIWVTGPLVNYAAEVKKVNGGTRVTPEILNWGAPFDARILYGGTIGETIGIAGAFQGFSAGTTTSQVRATWSFAPGLNLSLGNGFSFWSFGSAISNYTGVFPSTSGTGAEINYVSGNKGGINILVGSVGNGSTTAALGSDATSGKTPTTNLDDIRYVRVKYKFGGAGLLSGAGGNYGNEYNGLDDHFALGVSVVNAKPGVFNTAPPSTSTPALPSTYTTFKDEQTVYGVDLSGNLGNLTGGVAYSKSNDLGLNNYQVNAGYYVYPWLFPSVTYKNLGVVSAVAGVEKNNPTVSASVATYLRANVSLTATYLYNVKDVDPSTQSADGQNTATSQNNKNTFTLNVSMGF